MRRGPRGRMRRAGTDLDHIRDAVPLTVKLTHLLMIHIERERYLMIVLGGFGLYHRQIKRTARSRIQNAHQCSLRVAIAYVKSLHVSSLAPASRLLSGG